jgi:hypothetical protein
MITRFLLCVAILSTLFLIIPAQSAHAASITAVQSGNWNDPAT